MLEEVINTHKVDASALCVEITESAVVSDAVVAADALTRLRQMGAAIALDDFGTGQSSLSQLAKLPIDRVKIDKSFVLPSSEHPNALRLLRSIVGVCQTLEIPIVAEGIEDNQAAVNLATMGVEFGQGYFFSRPIPASDFIELINSSVPAQRGGSDEVEGDAASQAPSTDAAARSHLRAM